MKQRFLTTLGVSRAMVRTGVILLFIFCLTVEPLVFGQERVLTKEQLSRLTLSQRASLFEPAFARIAYEEQVDPNLLWTIGYLETRFRPWLCSPAGAEGLMQFIPATARRFNLFNPYRAEPAIRAAAQYVRFLSNRFGGRIDSVLAGYNAGEGAVDAYLWGKTVRTGKKIINERGIKTVGGVPPYSETTAYVARGLIVYRLLKIKGKFPGSFAAAVYPPNISERVARVWLNDNEIGFTGTLLTQMNNPQFWNIQTVAQNPIPDPNTVSNNPQKKGLTNKKSTLNTLGAQINYPVVTTAETVATNSNADNPKEEKALKNPSEIFYEPRTGARYRTGQGNIERLPENGDLIVGAQTLVSPQPKTIRARGTFFGGKISQPK